MSKNRKRIIWGIIILVGVVGAYFIFKDGGPKVEYTTAEVTRGTLVQTVSSTGTYNPDRQYELAFKTSGTVVAMNVDVGDQVQEGELLAELDKGTLLSQLAQAEAAVKAEQETLDNLTQHKHKVSSTDDTRDAQRARLEQAKAGVKIIRDQFKDTLIYSPIDGVVIKRFASVGEQTFVNAARSASILTVADKEMVIESSVPESDVVKLEIGQKANVTFDALSPDEVFPAEIVKIDPASTVIQDVVYYVIELRLLGSDERLKAGMSANIDVHAAEKENVLMIPLRAVKSEGGWNFVEILLDEEKNIVQKVKVETGMEGDEGFVEVKSGPKEGEKVITFTKAL